jgi:hypothetical protein
MATTCLVLTWWLLPGLGLAAAGLAWLAGEFAGALLVLIRGAARRPPRQFVLRQRTRKTWNRRRPPSRTKEAAVR